MPKKGYKYMKEVEFTRIKSLQNAGVTVSVAAKAMDRSYNTINYIFQSDNFEDYKVKRMPKPVTVSESVPTNPVLTHDAGVESLVNIDKRLARIEAYLGIDEHATSANTSIIKKRRFF